MPYWSVHETWGVNAHLGSENRAQVLNPLIPWGPLIVAPVATRSAGAAVGSTGVEGSDPPSPKALVRGAGAVRDFTRPAPRPWGVAPLHQSLREGLLSATARRWDRPPFVGLSGGYAPVLPREGKPRPRETVKPKMRVVLPQYLTVLFYHPVQQRLVRSFGPLGSPP